MMPILSWRLIGEGTTPISRVMTKSRNLCRYNYRGHHFRAVEIKAGQETAFMPSHTNVTENGIGEKKVLHRCSLCTSFQVVVCEERL